MRTTVNIDDGLLAEAKAHALRSGKTLGAVIDDALRESMDQRRKRPATQLPELPVSRGGRLLPGVDLDDGASLLDVMDGPVR